MLSIFYYLRTLDFNRMKKNTTVSSTVFSGRKKERIDIRFIGVENIELRNKETRKAYHVVFTFTQDGRKKSSDDMHMDFHRQNAYAAYAERQTANRRSEVLSQ